MSGRPTTAHGGEPRWSSLSTLVAVNAALVVLAAVAGALVAQGSATRMIVAGTDGLAGGRVGAMTHDWWQIFSTNGVVVVLFVLGALSLGVFTLAQLLWNGYVLGFGLSSLARGAPEYLPLLARYVPLEFLALTLAAAASQRLALTAFHAVTTKDPPQWRGIGSTLAAAIAMLAVAALIEADVTRVIGVMRAPLVEGP